MNNNEYNIQQGFSKKGSDVTCNTMRRITLLISLLFLLKIQVLGNSKDDLICQFWINHSETTLTKNLIMHKNPTNEINKNICLLYLKRYEEKDLKGIEEMFSDNIVLRDWKIRVEGKEKALIETRKNFESVKSIKIDVLSIYENENTVAAELKISINGIDELYVVDVITINPDGKISSIKAFIGRGDK